MTKTGRQTKTVSNVRPAEYYGKSLVVRE
jgi:hypothetical protein